MDLLQNQRDSDSNGRDVHSLRGSILLDKKDNKKKKRRDINEPSTTCCFCFRTSPSKSKKQKKNREKKQDHLDLSIISGLDLS